MKKSILLLALFSLALVSCIKETGTIETLSKDDYLNTLVDKSKGKEIIQGNLLIKVTDELAAKIEKGTVNYNQLFGCSGIETCRPALISKPKNIDIAKEIGLLNWMSVEFDRSIAAEEMARILVSHPDVLNFQYNSCYKPIISEKVCDYSPSALTKSDASGSLPFNDPLLIDQWNLINTGNKEIASTSVAGADVGVKDAWKLTTGDPEIIVAVFDEGIMVSHEDLVDNLWQNTAEINGEPGVDDDGNGYVDDKHGYNFIEEKGRPSATGNAYTGHGTHVAGTIAATNGNGIGVSSIAGGSGNGDGVRLMSCQIFRKAEKASDKTTANAFIYACDNGASIAQCSFGSAGGLFTSDEEYIAQNPFTYEALEYFMDPQNSNCPAMEKNIIVFAAGNESAHMSSYPGALPFCISVTAFGPDFLPGGFSNRGPGCDIAAPGGDPWIDLQNQKSMILSTGITAESGYQSVGYVYNYGTSMACPHVSGVIALGMSYAMKIGKNFSWKSFVSKLLTSVNDIDQFMHSGIKQYNNTTFELSSYKGKMGTGAVDAWKFLMALEGTPVVLTSPGKTISVDLRKYIGETVNEFKYDLIVDPETVLSLGLEEDPVIEDDIMTLKCSSIGAGKISFVSSVGDGGDESDIQGLKFVKEISIVSRSSVAENGGWL